MVYDRKYREHRPFILKMGLPDNDYGREITVIARSSLEAGEIIMRDELIPDNYIAHSLRDTAL